MRSKRRKSRKEGYTFRIEAEKETTQRVKQRNVRGSGELYESSEEKMRTITVTNLTKLL